MKKLTLILLLLATKSQAQTKFFVGIGGAYNHCSIQNAEDKKAPSGMLIQKGTFQPSYGLQLGLQFGKHWEVSLAPNYQNFKTTYSGKSDTTNILDFNSTLKMSYLNIPIQLNYLANLSDKLTLFFGVGANLGIMSTFKEEVIGHSYLGSSSLFEFKNVITKSEIEVEVVNSTPLTKSSLNIDKPFYKETNYSVLMQTGITYSITESLKLRASILASKGVSDIENKTKIMFTSADVNFVPSTVNQWNENNHYHYYTRPTSEFDKRPASTTLSIGFGLGIQYSLGNSTSSSNNYQ